MNWLQWVTWVFGTLLPQVLQLIILVEQKIGPGNGATKEEMVIGAVVNSARAAGATGAQVEIAAATAKGLVAEHVASLNRAGIFQHKDAGAGGGAPAVPVLEGQRTAPMK